MSRPKNLPAALQAWALANYAAGPSWGGTPQRSAPGASFLTPQLTLPAEVANYLHGNAFDAVQGAVNAGGQLPSINWTAAVSIGVASNAVCAWSDQEQAWYAFNTANTTSQFRTPDFGKTWSGVTIATACIPLDCAFDPIGNAVLVGQLANIESGAYTAFGTALAWTNVASAVATFAAARAQYEPTNATWCVIGQVAATGYRVYTSTNRTTWTAATIPTAWSTYSGATGSIGLGVGNGLLVASFADSATTFRVMKSSNGGVTWSDQQITVATGGLSATSFASGPLWSPTDATWYLLGSAAGSKFYLYSSPDAVTWSLISTVAAGSTINFLTVIGSLLTGVGAADGRVIVSVNGGVNWFRAGVVNLAPVMARAGGGGMLALGSSTASPSLRFGMPAQAV